MAKRRSVISTAMVVRRAKSGKGMRGSGWPASRCAGVGKTMGRFLDLLVESGSGMVVSLLGPVRCKARVVPHRKGIAVCGGRTNDQFGLKRVEIDVTKQTERTGFEPVNQVYPGYRFSKPALSATQPPLQAYEGQGDDQFTSPTKPAHGRILYARPRGNRSWSRGGRQAVCPLPKA